MARLRLTHIAVPCLAASIFAAALWWRSHRHPTPYQYSFVALGARYTAFSHRGKIILRGPPAPTSARKRAAAKWSKEISNDDLEWRVSVLQHNQENRVFRTDVGLD